MSEQNDLIDKTYDDILAAKARLKQADDLGKKPIVKTPARYSHAFSAETGADVWMKLEIFQRTGSYKERGARNMLLRLQEENKHKHGVIAASAGNHAQGVACHAQRLGIPARIVMPKTTPKVKIDRTKSFDAEVILVGDTYDDAKKAVATYQEDRVLVPPFDHEDIIAGQGTVALEFLKQVEDLETLIIPIGGGGLLAGMAVAAKKKNPNIRIIGAEPLVCPSFFRRMQGHLTTKPLTNSIAEGIFVAEVGEKTFAIARDLVDDVILVSEANFERAISRFAQFERLVVEGAGAAALGALLTRPSQFEGQRCGIVVSGGNIDMRLLQSVLTRAMVHDGRLAVLSIVCPDQPGNLAKITRTIADSGGNIISIGHHRAVTSRPAKSAEVEVEIEVDDAAHLETVLVAVRYAGFEVSAVSGHLDA